MNTLFLPFLPPGPEYFSIPMPTRQISQGGSTRSPHNPPIIAPELYQASVWSSFLLLLLFFFSSLSVIFITGEGRDELTRPLCLSEGSWARLMGPVKSRKANDWNSALDLIFFSVHIILCSCNLIYNIISYSSSKAELLSLYVHIFFYPARLDLCLILFYFVKQGGWSHFISLNRAGG